MVFSLTIDFLQQRFPKKLELERFSQTDTKELYSALLKKVSKDEVIENRQEIRRAIVEYAKDTAKSVVLFRALDQITIKFAPLDKLDSASDEYKKLLNIIKEKKENIKQVDGREDLLCFDESFTRAFFETLSNVDFVDSKDAIRRSIKESLQFNEKDAVLFLNNQIFVRLFLDPNRKQVSNTERRFGGLPPEELERLKNELFKDSVVTVFRELVDLLVKNELDFAIINNDFFEKNALALVQAQIVNYLKDKLSYEDEIINSFAAYLLRENFLEIHEFLAFTLLEKVAEANINAERFVKYYSGDITVIDGTKYRLPEIVDSLGSRWNFSTIKAITTQYKHSTKTIEERAIKTKEAKGEYENFDLQIEKAKKELEKSQKELDSVKRDVDESGVALAKLREDLASARKEALRNSTDEIEASILELSSKIKNATANDEDLFKARSRSEILVKEKERQLEQLEHKKIITKRKIEEEEEKLKTVVKNQQEIANKYKIMQSAVAKALTKKRVKI